MLAVAPDYLEALRALGDLSAYRGDSAEAAASYERVLSLDPTDEGTAGKLAKLRAGRTAATGPP